jgi:hypothetical protein
MLENIKDHVIISIDIVKNNQEVYINQCVELHAVLTRLYGPIDTTQLYWRYNLFNISCSSVAFYRLWKEINIKIREYVGDSRPLWMTGWLNFHSSNEVLDWHNHKLSVCHGYISIDPKNTVTEFENYAIENIPGQLYLGPSEQMHRVVVKEAYTGPRITIGFDVSDKQNEDHINSNFHSFIPVF